MSQLKKGAILSYATIFLTNVIGLVLTPFIIKSLGNAEYGLYMLIGAFVGYISVLDFGLNNTIVRFVAKYRAEGDKKGEENFLATTMWIYGIISVIIGLLGVILYFNLETIFGDSLTVGELGKAKVMFIILIFNLVITLPGGAFTAVCAGYEHFVYPRTINIVRYVVRSALVVALLLYGGDAIGLVLLDTVMNILVIGFNGWYVFKKLNISFRIHEFKIPLIKEIFSYSLWVFILALVYELQWKGGHILVGIKTDTTTVAIYAVGVLLGTYYGAFASAINGVFLPRAMKMVVNNSTGMELTNMTVRIGRITLMILFLILGGFILFGKEFIELWVGETYYSSWLIALIIMVSSTNILVLSFANSILKARSLFKFKGITYLFLIVMGTFTGFFMIDVYGSTGMIIGISTGWGLSQIILNFYMSKKLKLNISKIYNGLFGRFIFIFLFTLLMGYGMNYFFESISWITLFIKIILFSILYIVAIYLLNMNEYEKNLIKSTLKIR